jgi:hypothetical protein
MVSELVVPGIVLRLRDLELDAVAIVLVPGKFVRSSAAAVADSYLVVGIPLRLVVVVRVADIAAGISVVANRAVIASGS